jgi:hypothetical protein
LLVVEDFLLLTLDCGELGIERRDVIFLFDDFAEGGFDFWVDGFLLEEDLDLVVVEVGEGVAGFDCARFSDDERSGGFCAEGQTGLGVALERFQPGRRACSMRRARWTLSSLRAV